MNTAETNFQGLRDLNLDVLKNLEQLDTTLNKKASLDSQTYSSQNIKLSDLEFGKY